MKKIPLNGKHGKGKFALVDDEDYEELMQYSWFFLNRGYATRYANSKTILMHRDILHPQKGLMVDHINHNKLDNRKINLRECTNSQNQQNSKGRKDSLSVYKGVSFYKNRNKWGSRITYNTNTLHLGLFITELEAAKAYNAKAKELFGEFAHLNKI